MAVRWKSSPKVSQRPPKILLPGTTRAGRRVGHGMTLRRCVRSRRQTDGSPGYPARGIVSSGATRVVREQPSRGLARARAGARADRGRDLERVVQEALRGGLRGPDMAEG